MICRILDNLPSQAKPSQAKPLNPRPEHPAERCLLCGMSAAPKSTVARMRALREVDGQSRASTTLAPNHQALSAHTVKRVRAQDFPELTAGVYDASGYLPRCRAILLNALTR